MKSRGSIICILIVLFVVISIISVRPALAETIGTITFIDGRVDILTSGQDIALPLASGAPVSTGDIIRTKSNARAEITLADGTVIRLAESTRIGLTASTAINFTRGRMRTIIPAGNQGVEVLTPNGKARTNGTDFYFIHEKGSSWFYGGEGTLQASGNQAPENIATIENRNCVRIASGIPMENSCVFKDVDVQKYAWDTSTVENTPVVAKLPTEGEVYTYTPLGGRPVDTPSMYVPVQNQDLVCTQCPPEFRPEVQRTVTPTPTPITKEGYWERTDPCSACSPRPQ